MFASLGPAKISHCRQQLPQRFQWLRGRCYPLHLRAPRRIVLAIPYLGTGLRMLGINVPLLRFLGWFGTVSVAASVAFRSPCRPPIHRAIDCALEVPGIDESLVQFQRMPPGPLPIGAQAAQHFSHDAAPQVRSFALLGQQQESGMFGNQMQPAKSLSLFPPEPPISGPALEHSALLSG